MKRILTLAVFLLALSSQAFAATRTATFGDYNAAGQYRLKADMDTINGVNVGYLTFAQDTGIYYPYISTATTSTTLLASQTGATVVFNNGAGTAANGTTYTLPASAVGMQFTFVSDVAKYFRLAPTGTDVFKYSTATTNSKLSNVGSALAGDSITVFCSIAGEWSISDRAGTWTVDNNP